MRICNLLDGPRKQGSRRHFAWRLEQTFEFSWLCSRVWPITVRVLTETYNKNPDVLYQLTLLLFTRVLLALQVLQVRGDQLGPLDLQEAQ